MFQPNPWNCPTEAQSRLGTDSAASDAAGKVMYPKVPPEDSTETQKTSWSWDQVDISSWFRPQETLQEFEADFEEGYKKDRAQPTDIEEVWFAGCHCGTGCLYARSRLLNFFYLYPILFQTSEVGQWTTRRQTRSPASRCVG
jgi:hypothetical protein